MLTGFDYLNRPSGRTQSFWDRLALKVAGSGKTLACDKRLEDAMTGKIFQSYITIGCSCVKEDFVALLVFLAINSLILGRDTLTIH